MLNNQRVSLQTVRLLLIEPAGNWWFHDHLLSKAMEQKKILKLQPFAPCHRVSYPGFRHYIPKFLG